MSAESTGGGKRRVQDLLLLASRVTPHGGSADITLLFKSIMWGWSVCAQLIVAQARQTASLASPARLDLRTGSSGDAYVE